MSGATVAIWISCGSLLVSASSLVVAAAAYRRSETRRRLDQRERTSPGAARSRASAALDHMLGGALSTDAAAVREPRGQLRGASARPKRVDHTGVEKTQSVTAQHVRTRLEQLVQYMRDKTRATNG